MASRAGRRITKSTNVRVGKAHRRVVHSSLSLLWCCAPGLTRELVTRTFFVPATYDVSDAERRWKERGRPFSIRVRGRKIRGWKWGCGPGVLLVHGWNGSGLQFERFLGPLVEAGYTVVAYDGPAHGDSEGRDSSYFEFTEVVRAFLSPRRGFDIRAVIAHSLGASAVINALSREPRKPAVVLVAPALKLRDMLWTTFDRYGLPRVVYGSLVDELGERFGYELQRDDPYLLFPRVQASTLVIHDENDRIVSCADSREACVRHPLVSLHTTRGLGHKRILRDDSVVRRAIAHLRGDDAGEEARALGA